MKIKSFSKLLDIIRKRNNFVLASHVNYDEDSISSLVLMANILKKFNKRFIIYFEEKIKEEHNWLPYQEKFTSKIKENFENVIILDCESYKRTGNFFSEWCEKKFKINIDHHLTNKYDSEVNFVLPESPSTSFILLKIYQKLKIIDPLMASILLLGIMGDTNYLTIEFDKKRLKSILKALCFLNDSDADFNLVNRTLNYKSWDNFLEEIRILSKVKKLGNIIYLIVESKEDKKAGNLANVLNKIREGKLVIVFKVFKDFIRLSFRSKGNIDVGYLAKKFFNGGGHKNSSGGILRMKIKEALPYVLKIAQKHLNLKKND
ncbi:MAG: DHHA1 domain-containing protein [Candidatus Aenigmatarchaeota archaeon]